MKWKHLALIALGCSIINCILDSFAGNVSGFLGWLCASLLWARRVIDEYEEDQVTP